MEERNESLSNDSKAKEFTIMGVRDYISVKLLYHYCSIEAFYNIIKTKSFRLFQSKSNSDEKEYCRIEKLAKDFIKGLKTYNCNKKYDIENDYCLSLTDKFDDAVMFEKYGANDTGICIGFNINNFYKLIDSLIAYDCSGIVTIQKVQYLDDNETKSSFNSELDSIIKTGFPSEMLQDVFYTVLSEKFGSIIKSKNYGGEGEYRLIFSPFNLEQMLKFTEDEFNKTQEPIYQNIFNQCTRVKDVFSLEKREFILSSSLIRKCSLLNIESFISHNVIEKIILGSKCRNTIKEIKDFLVCNGLNNVKIVSSKISKR